jgi:hypothetical protein
MGHGDTRVSSAAEASNISNSAADTRHMKQEMKMAKLPAHAKAKQEQPLLSKSTLRPDDRPQQSPHSCKTSKSKQALSSLPNDTPTKTRRSAPLELSDYFKAPGHEQQQPQQQCHDDIAKTAYHKQTVVANDEESVLENPTLTIQDLEQKIRQMHKLIKLAKRNTAKDQEAARRIARENEALEQELDTRSRSSLPRQTVEELTAACAKARQKVQDTDQAIVKLRGRLDRVHAEADVPVVQDDLSESSTDATITKIADTTTAATMDDWDEDDDISSRSSSNNSIISGSSESDDEDTGGLIIPLLPVYSPGTE